MKIAISSGYVLLREVVTRKIARAYNAALFSGVNVVLGGENLGGINPVNIEAASEELLLGLVEQVVTVNDSKETFVEPNKDWLDNLPEQDFKTLENAVIAIKDGREANAKK